MEQYISKSALLAEIERLVNNYDKALDYEAALEDVRNFIDSIEVKESAEIERDKETCKENGDSLTKEPVNVWHDMSEVAENGRNIIIISPKNFYGAVLRKGGSQLRNHNKERYVKWAYIDDLQKFSNVERTVKNRNEPVNDDLEKAAVEAFKQIVDSDKNNFLEIFKAGAKWQKEQMMAKAVDGVVTFDYYEGDKAYGCVAHDSFCLEDLGLKDMDEVKILILKNKEL